MAQRGRKPGTINPQGLPAKILAMKVGESMMLDDESASLDRALVTLKKRSPVLESVAFTATRVRWIDGDRLARAIRITRDA